MYYIKQVRQSFRIESMDDLMQMIGNNRVAAVQFVRSLLTAGVHYHPSHCFRPWHYSQTAVTPASLGDMEIQELVDLSANLLGLKNYGFIAPRVAMRQRRSRLAAVRGEILG